MEGTHLVGVLRVKELMTKQYNYTPEKCMWNFHRYWLVLLN